MRSLLRDIFIATAANTIAMIIVPVLIVAGKAALSMYQRTPDTIQKASQKSAIRIVQMLLDAGLCWFFADGLFTLVRSNDPLTRIDVVMLAALTFATLYAAMNVLLGVAQRKQ